MALGAAPDLCPRRTETGIAGRDGALTTRLIFPSRAAHLAPGVAAADAALVEPLAVAYRGVLRTGAGPGDALGVVGAGTIGLLCGLAARALGITDVDLVEVQPSRRQFAAGFGFSVIEPGTRRLPRVIDASGTTTGIATALAMCADGGTVVLLGLTGSGTVPLDVDGVVVRDLTVRGSLGSANVWPPVVDLVASGRVRPSTLVSHEYPLEQIVTAFETAARRDSGVLKVLVRPNSEPGHD